MERYNITIQMYSADASGTQYVWEKVPAEEGDFVLYADAQATIAALQARVQELEESRDAWKASQECSEKAYMSLVNQIPAERFDYDPVNVALLDGAKEQEIIGRKQIADLQSHLTQRTAELEAAKREVDVWKEKAELRGKEACAQRAELERVRGELAETKEVEVALSSKVAEYEIELNGDPQNFYGRGRTVGLRTLVLALPKVDGEIYEAVASYRYDKAPEAWFHCESQLIALLQHRQGMEG